MSRIILDEYTAPKALKAASIIGSAGSCATSCIVFFLLLLASGALAKAQAPIARLHDHNVHSWFVYMGDHPIRGRWGAHLEGQWRRQGIGRPQQLLLRPGINVRINRRFALSGGYAYISSHPYGEFPASGAFPEHRLHQQFTVQHGGHPAEALHRVRLEERWIALPLQSRDVDLQTRDWRYQNRLRYLLRVVVPMKSGWYFASSNEVYLNLPPVHGAKVFDQNRAFAGFGRTVAPSTRLEVGYMQQTLLQRNARVLELNHTAQVAIYGTLPLWGR